MKIEVSNGELLDKLTILEIKASRITDPVKLTNIRHELNQLRSLAGPLIDKSGDAIEELKLVNEELWEVEDRLRDMEKSGDFGPEFIEAARSVYRLNDRRASIKKRVNTQTGSQIQEEKSYSEY